MAEVVRVVQEARVDGRTLEAAILCEKYRKLARRYLRPLPALFTKFTGLFLHLAWAPAWPCRWAAQALPMRSWLCREVTAGRADNFARCRGCAARHLGRALSLAHKGHCFTCSKGLQNFWRPIVVRGCVIGLAFIQALALPALGMPLAPPPVRAHRPGTSTAAPGAPRRGAKRMSRREFGDAAKLLRLMVHHVETCMLADLRQSDLSQAREALLEMRTVATRLRTELNGLVPAFNQTAPVLEPENHAERLAHAALEFIDRHYSEPFTLRQFASSLGLNPAYVSAQFSRTIGIPFKTYLTEVRVEKARELLSDPARKIAEVAKAVGYASENRFRLAFKGATGLSPRRWRETLRMEPKRTI